MARLSLIVDPSGAERGFKRATDAAQQYTKRGARAAADATKNVTGSFRQLVSSGGGLSRVVGRIRGSFSSLTRTVFSLQGAIAGIGVGLLARSFISAASETETLKLRLETLTGSADDASKAFDTMTSFAAKVPFEFQEIQQAGGLLLAVTDDVDDLGKMLEITGDIAAASGLSFRETAGQIQRSFSAGINSADLFRERAVRDMLGFEAGVEISAEETRRHILSMWDEGVSNRLKGGAQNLADTWSGITSMMSDRWFQFRVSVMESGMFDFLKATLQELLSLVDQTFGGIQEAGAEASDVMIEGAKRIAIGTASVIDAMSPIFQFISQAINNLVGFYNNLPDGIKQWGLLGFMVIGSKARLITVTIAAIYSDVAQTINKVIAKVDEWVESLKSRLRELPFGDTLIADFTAAPRLPDNLGDLVGSVPGFGEAEDITSVSDMGQFEARTRQVIASIEERVEGMRKAASGKSGGGTGGQGGGGLAETVISDADLDQLKTRADSLTKMLRTPQEEFEDSLRELVRLQPFLDDETFDRALVMYAENLREAREQVKGLAGDHESAMDEMTQFSIQAARSAQSAFADFLFDPFKDGLDGMVAGFAEAIRRILSEAVAAQALEGLLGGDFMDKGELGGLAGQGLNWLTGFFHQGGIAGNAPQSRSLPALAFANAPRYHGGGIAGLAPGEVPAVLKRGEEILTEDNPRHRNNAGGVVINAPITINANDAQDVIRSRGKIQREISQAMQRGARRNT